MSYTKRQFVSAAFGSVGMAAYVFDLEPGQIQNAVRTMDSMIAAWNAEGIRISYPLPSSPQDSDLDQETNVPDSANEAIVMNLGIRLASEFGKTISPDLKTVAKKAKSILLSLSTKPIDKQYPSTLPVGAGNKQFRNDRVFFPVPEDKIAVGDDDVLEYE